ncbi:MAG: hypothetical protein H6604_08765 [Flavobacteriales bacterium]|nr:hypothetical protein [Flavobacteriales bacterium]
MRYLILIVGVLLISCNAYKSVSEEYDFELQYPKKWMSLNPVIQDGFFVSSEKVHKNQLAENVNIIKHKPIMLSFEKQIMLEVEQVIKYESSEYPLEMDTIRTEEYFEIKHNADFSKTNKNYQFVQRFIPDSKTDSVYIITFICENDKYKSLKPIQEKIFNSFKIK